MKRALVCALGAFLLSACDSTEPRVPTTVSLSTSTVTLDAIGASQRVAATVMDQNGKEMSASDVVWSSDAASVTVTPLGEDSATVTAVANGSATITAKIGSAQGTLQAQVSQTPSGTEKLGDAQTGAAGGALANPLRVKVTDRLGAPVAGVAVTFAVAAGGGTLSTLSVATGADGTAAATWTVGTTAGASNQVTAIVAGVPGTLTFGATVTPGLPSRIAVLAGDGQSAIAGRAVAVRPSVRVTDAFGNVVPGVTVVFTVTGGGGTLTGSAQVTDASGVATLDSWLLGGAGENTVSAAVAGSTATPAVFTATAIPLSGATRLFAHEGDDQSAMVGTAVSTAPAVRITDAAGSPLPGRTVVFSVALGGGTVTAATATSDGSGIARVGSWTLGSTATLNTVTATSAGAANSVTISAAGCANTGASAGFNITLCVSSTLSGTTRTALETAVNRWQRVITADLPSWPIDYEADECGHQSINTTVDDLVIFAAIEGIDGQNGTLGSAGPCEIRDQGFLPALGVMRFDVADIDLYSPADREALFLHEIGHVLGIGTLWNFFGLLQDRTTVGGTPLDTYYSGTHGRAGFDAIGGTSYVGGQKVPVENTGGGGTANSHWRETVFDTEVMTGFLDKNRAMPLSLLTIRSLMDMGYTVDVSQADAYTLAGSAQALRTRNPNAIPLHDDIRVGPIHVSDRSGRRIQRLR